MLREKLDLVVLFIHFPFSPLSFSIGKNQERRNLKVFSPLSYPPFVTYPMLPYSISPFLFFFSSNLWVRISQMIEDVKLWSNV